MGTESWLEQVKRRWNEKKIEKLRKQFGFLSEEYKNSMKEISTIFEKYMNILESDLQTGQSNIKNILDDRCSEIQETVSQSRMKTNSEYQEVIKVLRSINSQLELLQGNVNGIADTTRTIVAEKTSSIVLSIDEVKTLMKVVAVNNLLDEI